MDKNTAKQILRQKLIEKNPEMATVFAMQDLKESMDSSGKNALETLKIENMLEKLKTKGEDGYTPQKGIDYEDGHTPTDEELLALIKPLIPIIRQPEDGHTPTRDELLSLIKPLIPKVKDGETPSDERLISLMKRLMPEIPEFTPDTAEQIANKLNTLTEKIESSAIKGLPTIKDLLKEIKKGKLIEIRDIKNMPLNMSDMRWHGGGISEIIAGSGITATDDGSGHITVSAPGSTTDEKVKITSADTTPGYLQAKLVAGSNVTITKNNAGANETLTISSLDTGMLNPMTQAGDIIVGGAGGTPERKAIGTANQVLHGGASVPAYSAVVEADISLSNNSTNNASLTKHGFLQILPGGTTTFLRADGAFASPAGATVPNAYVEEDFGYTADTAHQIAHNFGTYPVVQCFDTFGYMVIPISIQQIDADTVELIFSKTATYKVILTVGSPPLSTITSVSADYSVLGGDYLIKVTASGKEITLPTAVGRPGKIFIVKNSSTGICSVLFTSGQNADGYTNVTIPAGDSYSFMSDDTNYIVF